MKLKVSDEVIFRQIHLTDQCCMYSIDAVLHFFDAVFNFHNTVFDFLDIGTALESDVICLPESL